MLPAPTKTTKKSPPGLGMGDMLIEVTGQGFAGSIGRQERSYTARSRWTVAGRLNSCLSPCKAVVDTRLTFRGRDAAAGGTARPALRFLRRGHAELAKAGANADEAAPVRAGGRGSGRRLGHVGRGVKKAAGCCCPIDFRQILDWPLCSTLDCSLVIAPTAAAFPRDLARRCNSFGELQGRVAELKYKLQLPFRHHEPCNP
jgi:hypothetical protein